MTRLLLIRHGQTDWNLEGRYQGQQDTHLNAQGLADAELLRKRLKDEPFDALYSSDLQRAYQTARIIRDGAVIADPRLREIGIGVFEGLTFSEMEAQYPQAFAVWQKSYIHSPPNGEPIPAVVARIRAFLAHIQTAHTGQYVGVVSHGALSRMLLCLALEIPPVMEWRFEIDNGSLSELHLTERGAVLLNLNDKHHMDGNHSG